ncbi:hypothetical protein HJG53_05975 [Sphingomonas sp. ID1715]|uniref:hypothetical protein n=1 Tax=Sphingomonas sp. ID1715 TaxID=1656898 RepID=UPI0014880D69|nr:hypothetical protein [Sphingomonas sp. ID1715]NNM76448.1 hypothetical protein [Sphingomonas sp. ID1715]
MNTLRAAIFYAGVIFGLGFAFGTVRVLLLMPRLGPISATLIEVPLMLAASWLVCGWSVRRWGLPRRFSARVAMSAMAFALLMGAEVLLGRYCFERSSSAQIAALTAPEGLIGLGAQLGFALMPLARR